MPPAISLIIPAWNRAQYIRAAMGSVLAQTRRDFELIVWDDGSTDDTVEVAKAFAGDDPRVRIVVAEHKGNPGALNAAASLASAPYIGWVDSDDAIAPTALADTSAILDANPSVGMVYSGCVYMNEAGKVIGVCKRSTLPYSKQGLLTDFITFQFRLLRRSVFDQIGGVDENLDAAFDYDFCLKASEITEIRHVNRPLYFYRIHPQTISHTRRLEQILCSQRAIESALKRRGMDKDYQIDLELIGKFRLRKLT